MKKLLPILVLLLALVMVFPVQADENMDYLNNNVQFVRDFLDGRSYTYRTEGENDDIFVLEFDIGGAYPDAVLYLSVYDDGVQCEAAAGISVEGQPLMELCRYIAHLNSKLRITSFYVDEYNEVWTANFCFSDEGRLNEDNLAFCYSSVLNNLADYSQDLHDILVGGASAAELIGQ